MNSVKRIVFLCSGQGGNLRFLELCIAQNLLEEHEIAAVFSDRMCGALEFAHTRGIRSQVLDFSKKGQIGNVMDEFKAVQPDLIITNIARILVPELVSAYSGKLINLHYSLLPSFGGTIGTRPVEDAFASGTRIIGCTSHHVTEAVDAGQPIMQIAFGIGAKDKGPGDVMDTMFRAGCLALFSAVKGIASKASDMVYGITEICGRSCLVSGPSISFPDAFNTSWFWEAVRNPETSSLMDSSQQQQS